MHGEEFCVHVVYPKAFKDETGSPHGFKGGIEEFPYLLGGKGKVCQYLIWQVKGVASEVVLRNNHSYPFGVWENAEERHEAIVLPDYVGGRSSLGNLAEDTIFLVHTCSLPGETYLTNGGIYGRVLRYRKKRPYGRATCGGTEQLMKTNPFAAACFANCTIPFGMVTVRDLGGLSHLLGVPVDLTTGEVETESIEDANSCHIHDVSKLTSKGELPGFSAEFIKQWAASPMRESWKGQVKDTGRQVAHGLMTLGALRPVLRLFHSGTVKNQKGGNSNQTVATLFRGKRPDDPAATKVAGRLKYLLGENRGTKDRAKALPDETLLEIYVWLNPDDSGWLRANFVIKSWHMSGEEPEGIGYLTHNGKPLEFSLQVIQEEESGASHEVLTLEPEWLLEKVGDMLRQVDQELQQAASTPEPTNDNPTFAGRA